MDDQVLVIDFQNGNAGSFGVLYDRYIRKIYDFVFFRVSHRETAEDLTSKVFVRALEHLPRFILERGTFQAWLFQIARNTVIDYYRTKKNEDDIDAHQDLRSPAHRIDATIDAKRTLERVNSFLLKLPQEQQEVIVLRLQGLSYREIGVAVGKTEAACKMVFSRAAALLRKSVAFVTVSAIAFAINYAVWK